MGMLSEIVDNKLPVFPTSSHDIFIESGICFVKAAFYSSPHVCCIDLVVPPLENIACPAS